MLLSDFLKKLALTSLGKTCVLDTTQTYFIKTTELEKIIHYINAGLSYLYTKHLLLQKQQLIELVEPYTTYYLREEYAKSNSTSTETYKYLVDEDIDGYRFYPHIIKVLFAYDGNGKNLELNDVNVLDSVHTISHDTLQINHNQEGSYVNVVYQAAHEPITSTDIALQYIRLPLIMIDSLCYYIGHLYFQDQLGTKNLQQSQIFMTKFITSENTAIQEGLIYNYQTTNLKLEHKGFV